MKTKTELVELLKRDVQAFNAYRQELIEQEIYDLDLSGVNLSGTNLCCANLSGAKLRNANLSGADLRYVDLRYVDLRHAKLSDTNLGRAILSCAKLDQEFLQVTGLGSERRMTTYLFEDDLIFCGCFKGSLKEFKKRVKETYPDENNKYRKQYLKFIKYIKFLKNME